MPKKGKRRGRGRGGLSEVFADEEVTDVADPIMADPQLRGGMDASGMEYPGYDFGDREGEGGDSGGAGGGGGVRGGGGQGMERAKGGREKKGRGKGGGRGQRDGGRSSGEEEEEEEGLVAFRSMELKGTLDSLQEQTPVGADLQALWRGALPSERTWEDGEIDHTTLLAAAPLHQMSLHHYTTARPSA